MVRRRSQGNRVNYDSAWPASGAAGGPTLDLRELDAPYLLLFWLQVFVEKRKQRLLGFDRIVAFEAMAGARQREQLGLDVGRFQFVDQPDRLFVGHVFVFRP